jgi:pimeloyl-ACP methyl ester carboxylesterase
MQRTLQRIVTPAGVTVSNRVYGEGPPHVLVHGAFSDHDTNWEFVAPRLAASFTVHAIARRGRGATDATTGHGIADEATDVVAVLAAIGAPAFLLGHSYGAQVALEAARAARAAVRKLVLYEPAWPRVVDEAALAVLEAFAANGDWDGLATYFFSARLGVPDADVRAQREIPRWDPIVGDAKA